MQQSELVLSLDLLLFFKQLSLRLILLSSGFQNLNVLVEIITNEVILFIPINITCGNVFLVKQFRKIKFTFIWGLITLSKKHFVTLILRKIQLRFIQCYLYLLIKSRQCFKLRLNLFINFGDIHVLIDLTLRHHSLRLFSLFTNMAGQWL